MMRAQLSHTVLNRSRQRGVAVILALLIVMLAATLAAYMAQQQDLWQRQVENQFNWTQARKIGIAAIDWARAMLADDANTNNFDHPSEIWTKRLPAATVENGEILGVIEDQQGLFNLNNLAHNGVASMADVARFKHLLTLLDLPTELAPALSDWIDSDNETQYQGGAEDAYYLSQLPPYRTANRPLVDLDELLWVKGFDVVTLKRLRPYVSALPTPTPINVNFAQPEVLAAVIGGLTISEARIMVQQRVSQPFKTVEDFGLRLPPKKQVPIEMVTVSSQFFMVRGYANFGRSQVVNQALLQRTVGWPTVVWQKIQ